MEKSNDSGPKLVEIDLNKLTLPELSRQKQQLDQVCICTIKLLLTFAICAHEIHPLGSCMLVSLMLN